MKQQCAMKEGLLEIAFDAIDWDAVEALAHSLPELFNVWMTKHVSGFCPCGKKKMRWLGILG
jgi:hypothetical protein